MLTNTLSLTIPVGQLLDREIVDVVTDSGIVCYIVTKGNDSVELVETDNIHRSVIYTYRRKITIYPHADILRKFNAPVEVEGIAAIHWRISDVRYPRLFDMTRLAVGDVVARRNRTRVYLERVTVAPKAPLWLFQGESGIIEDCDNGATTLFPGMPWTNPPSVSVPATGSIVADCWGLEYKVTAVNISVEGQATLTCTRDGATLVLPCIQLRLISGSMLNYTLTPME